jgi:hypothetical protein
MQERDSLCLQQWIRVVINRRLEDGLSNEVEEANEAAPKFFCDLQQSLRHEIRLVNESLRGGGKYSVLLQFVLSARQLFVDELGSLFDLLHRFITGGYERVSFEQEGLAGFSNQAGMPSSRDRFFFKGGLQSLPILEKEIEVGGFFLQGFPGGHTALCHPARSAAVSSDVLISR